MIRINGGSLGDRIAHLVSLHSDDLPHGHLCDLMNGYGSNKADRVNHAYTPFYAALLDGMDARHVFEAGIGSQDFRMPYRMGSRNKPGGSLRAWREFFPNAQVFGADLDPAVMFTEERIETFTVNVLSDTSIKEMWQAIKARMTTQTAFDLIIDDAHHTFNANTKLFQHSFEMLRPGGIYIIEDIDTHHGNNHHTSRMADFLQAAGVDAVVVEIAGSNRLNNAFAAVLAS